VNVEDRRDRRDRLRALTAEAARGSGRLPDEAAPGASVASPAPGPAPDPGPDPGQGALFVLPATADFPLEWLLLEPSVDGTDRWLAVPADTNPLRGPGDVWIGPDTPAGPLCLRCRFPVRLPGAALRTGRRTGQVPSETASLVLKTVRDHERGALDPGPLALEVAEGPEYQDWEDAVLRPACEAAAALPATAPAPEPRREPSSTPGRSWLPAVAAALALVSLGLGAWNLALRRQVDRLSSPILIGGSQEVVVGTPDRGPATLRIRPGDQRLLVFVVLSGAAADHQHYRVELTDDRGGTVWQSPVVTPGAIPELNLVIPRQILEGSPTPTTLGVYAIEGGRAQRLAEVPLQLEHAEDAP